MSVQAISWVLDHSESQGATRCVLMSIANHVGVDGEGWVYVEQVMREANCSHDSYKRAIKWAVENGELAREVNRGEARKAAENRKPNHFRLLKLGGASCIPQDGSGGRGLHPPTGASCPVQDAPPEPSLSLEPSKEPLSPSVDSRVQEAFDLLVERDLADVDVHTSVRGARITCRKEREQDGTLGLLHDLAGKQPGWSAVELADGIEFGEVCAEYVKHAELPDCDRCENTRWEQRHDGVVRCSSCWPDVSQGADVA